MQIITYDIMKPLYHSINNENIILEKADKKSNRNFSVSFYTIS